MTSPRKKIDLEKQSTMFGQLLAIEKQTTAMTHQMINDIGSITKLQTDFTALQKQAKMSTNDSKSKASEQIRQFEDRIKNYLIGQKAEYMRFAGQISSMIQNSKEINAQLTLLGNKFEDFQKNVGI